MSAPSAGPTSATTCRRVASFSRISSMHRRLKCPVSAPSSTAAAAGSAHRLVRVKSQCCERDIGAQRDGQQRSSRRVQQRRATVNDVQLSEHAPAQQARQRRSRCRRQAARKETHTRQATYERRVHECVQCARCVKARAFEFHRGQGGVRRKRSRRKTRHGLQRAVKWG
jgi:hypothetical protein